MSYIEAAIQGRLGGLPVQRQTQAGKPFVTLSLIVQEKGAEHGEWVDLSVFEPLVHELPEGLAKGERIYAVGKLRLRRWEDKQGQARVNLQLTATELLALDRIGRRRRAPSAQSSPADDSEAAKRDYARPHGQEIAA